MGPNATKYLSIVDGWHICEQGDGHFVVRDDQEVVAGPFRAKGEATAAARRLPKRTIAAWTMDPPKLPE